MIMTATHILFVAWQSADEKSAQAAAWANVGNMNKSKEGARRYKAVVYKPNKRSENLKKMQVGQIYILGHGAAGYGKIADIDGDARVELTAGQIADRLFESGLNPAFMGAIKCFSCDSANSANGELAFADVFAYEMRRRKYIHCRYFGYTRPLEAVYADYGFHEVNNGVFIQHKHALENVNGKYVAMNRAKEYREEF
jgi:hypothetical protein